MGKSPLRLLIVEDEAAHAAAIQRAFEADGAETQIEVVRTLQEFRRCSADHPPDLALLDLNLPDGRAVEVMTNPPEAGPFPIMVMTSYGNEQVAVEAIKAGALDYVVKSAEAFVMMPRTVERALREWKLLTERRETVAAQKQLIARLLRLQENPRRPRLLEPGGGLHPEAHRRPIYAQLLPGVRPEVFVETGG